MEPLLRTSFSPSRNAIAAARLYQKRTAASAASIRDPLPYHDLPHPPPPSSPTPPLPPTPSRPHPSTSPSPNRKLKPQETKPFSAFLTDTFARQHDYLRISVTERCNLRCTYCMPEAGVPLSPPAHLLTTPEIVYLSQLFVAEGVRKIRLTGGEPTVRGDIVGLMQEIGKLRVGDGEGGGGKGLRELCITTNGVALKRKLDAMVEAGLTGVNLSLDTLDPYMFQVMTRRKGFEAVMGTVERMLEMKRLGWSGKLKINCVVMRGVNEREILKFVEMGREKDIEVRFIEYMPFEGNKWERRKVLGYKEMLEVIGEKFPGVRKVRDEKNDTSKTYEVPGFVGRFGFITSMTDNFCGTCNRLRITSDGNLKVCLFGNKEVSLRDVLRKGNDGRPIDEEAMEALKRVEMDRSQSSPGFAGPLGYGETERELLEVIGMAVKRKKEKHAGMGELENMKNRPMILIAPPLGPYLLGSRGLDSPSSLRALHVRRIPGAQQKLPHLNSGGEARMVDVSTKDITHRVALAIGYVRFCIPSTYYLVRKSALKKGDVLAVARVAGIQAVKNTASLIPLAHAGLPIEGVDVRVELAKGSDPAKKSRDLLDGSAQEKSSTREKSSTENKVEDDVEKKLWARSLIDQPIEPCGGVRIAVEVKTTAKTGVEMEALTGVMGAALTVVDMIKGVDPKVCISNVRVVGKIGGRSGGWLLGRQLHDGSQSPLDADSVGAPAE
ncbi:uncharacterized protein KY384_006652 [Bacidia gigantensis]|uniref:uncharacterized protein n=1 Tax=Bacidia gigantensis TaxID=2732470 RepID=UPI001D04862E|nr:uncharacterized protein KY384_006652 [Bacidia gigantensis]KAG8528963.1 hypothetical protein KY384_006652 [Bacidia gigantensis]